MLIDNDCTLGISHIFNQCAWLVGLFFKLMCRINIDKWCHHKILNELFNVFILSFSHTHSNWMVFLILWTLFIDQMNNECDESNSTIIMCYRWLMNVLLPHTEWAHFRWFKLIQPTLDILNQYEVNRSVNAGLSFDAYHATLPLPLSQIYIYQQNAVQLNFEFECEFRAAYIMVYHSWWL